MDCVPTVNIYRDELINISTYTSFESPAIVIPDVWHDISSFRS